jgi:DNA repair exonuclease SbcCD nuclease subunit
VNFAGKDGIPTYVIPGNHDLTSENNSNLDYLAEISISGELPNLHVAHATTPEVWKLQEGLYVYGVPVGFSENQAWVEQYTAKLQPQAQYIFMGHGSIRSSYRNDAGWRPSAKEDAKTLSLDKAAQDAPHVIYWAYGDIHKRQKLPLPEGANGWYAGSPIQMDFGEEPDRGVLVLGFESDINTWRYLGKKYVRIDDDKQFDVLVTVTSEDQIASLPENALIRLGKGLTLPKSRHEQIVKDYNIVEDRSLPTVLTSPISNVEAFDPLLADLDTVERAVLDSTLIGNNEAKKMVGLAVERYRNRQYLS